MKEYNLEPEKEVQWNAYVQKWTKQVLESTETIDQGRIEELVTRSYQLAGYIAPTIIFTPSPVSQAIEIERICQSLKNGYFKRRPSILIGLYDLMMWDERTKCICRQLQHSLYALEQDDKSRAYAARLDKPSQKIVDVFYPAGRSGITYDEGEILESAWFDYSVEVLNEPLQPAQDLFKSLVWHCGRAVHAGDYLIVSDRPYSIVASDGSPQYCFRDETKI